MKKLLLILSILLSLQTVCAPMNAWAAQANATPGLSQDFRRNALSIIFASLGGAVLGLSTLSFYGDPQEHTGNITTGMFLGLVSGVGYVVYQNSPSQQRYRQEIYDGVKRFGPPQSIPVATFTYQFN